MREETLFKNLRRMILFQTGFCILVLIIAWLMDGLNPDTIGIVYTSVGGSILAVSSFLMLSGYILSSWATYSLSGAGEPDKHSKNIEEAKQGRPVFQILALLNGFLLLLVGSLLQSMGG